MTRQDVLGNMLIIRAIAENKEKIDDKVVAEAAINLIEGFLVTQVEIRDLLQSIQDFGANQAKRL